MSLTNQKSKKVKGAKGVVKKLKPTTNGHVVRLDLGCGENKQQGFVGVDLYKVPGVDVVHDLTKYPYPFKDKSVDEIFCSHFVEHLSGPERIPFFNELYRILKDGGKARIITPYYKSVRAVQDPTHKWPPLAENSYLYLNKGWRQANKLEHYLGFTCNFDYLGTYSIQDPEVGQREESARNFWIDKYWNVVADLIVDLTKV